MKFQKLEVFVSVMAYNSSALILMMAPSEELREIDFASSLWRKQFVIEHYFLERPIRAKETLYQSSNAFALFSVAYLQMTPAVDPHPATVPKPQEGSPSGD